MDKVYKAMALGVPFLLLVAFFWIEAELSKDLGTREALTGLNEVAKKAVEMDVDLAKFFIGLSTAVIGGVAYYLKSAKDYRPHTRFSAFLVIGTLALSALSIFFGHLWLALMRNQIVSCYLDLQSKGIVNSERAQYGTFLLSLTWFAIFVWEREGSRAKGDEEVTL